MRLSRPIMALLVLGLFSSSCGLSPSEDHPSQSTSKSQSPPKTQSTDPSLGTGLTGDEHPQTSTPLSNTPEGQASSEPSDKADPAGSTPAVSSPSSQPDTSPSSATASSPLTPELSRRASLSCTKIQSAATFYAPYLAKGAQNISVVKTNVSHPQGPDSYYNYLWYRATVLEEYSFQVALFILLQDDTTAQAKQVTSMLQEASKQAFEASQNAASGLSPQFFETFKLSQAASDSALSSLHQFLSLFSAVPECAQLAL